MIPAGGHQAPDVAFDLLAVQVAQLALAERPGGEHFDQCAPCLLGQRKELAQTGQVEEEVGQNIDPSTAENPVEPLHVTPLLSLRVPSGGRPARRRRAAAARQTNCRQRRGAAGRTHSRLCP